MLPVLLCFDVEPDGFFIDPSRRDPWAGFEATFAFIEALRPRWTDLTGVQARVSWFMRLDPQIARTYGRAEWVLRHYEREFTRLEYQGDELAVHPHAYRWQEARGAWTLDYADQDWIAHCVESSCDAYTRVIGRPCRSIRMGDGWMNQETARLIASLGFAHDLTVEPGRLPGPLHHAADRVAGMLPDTRQVPTHPYRPAADNYQQADPARTSGPWIIPMSTAHVRPRLLRALYYRVRHPARRMETWTALLSHEPLVFARIIADVLARPRPYLAIAMRTNALLDPRLRARVSANVETLLRHLRDHAWAAVTPRDAIAWHDVSYGSAIASALVPPAQKTPFAFQ